MKFSWFVRDVHHETFQPIILEISEQRVIRVIAADDSDFSEINSRIEDARDSRYQRTISDESSPAGDEVPPSPETVAKLVEWGVCTLRADGRLTLTDRAWKIVTG